MEACNKCTCAADAAKDAESTAKWNAMSKAEQDAEIADMQANLAAVAMDPNMTIVTGQWRCICECHFGTKEEFEKFLSDIKR